MHWQGYVEFKKPQRLAALKKLIPAAHWEVRRGTREQALEYCRKEESRIRGPFYAGLPWGTGGQGCRTDLQEVKRKIDEGASELRIADEHFAVWCRHSRAFREYRRLKVTNRNWKTQVIMLIGDPGTGKSKKVNDEYPGAYWKQRSIWWCGYEGQEHVVLDDFYGWLPFDILLRICDRYPLLVETKGGQVTFLAKTVLITSNKEPCEWYDTKKCNMEALYRRVDQWWVFKDGYPPIMYTTYNDFNLCRMGITIANLSPDLSPFEGVDIPSDIE